MEPYGTTPVGVTPKQSGGRLARFVIDDVALAIERQNKGIRGVEFRKSADAVRRKEFVFVEKITVNALEFPQVGDRKQQPRAVVRLAAHIDVIAHFGIVIEKPLHACAKAGELAEVFGLE